MSFSLKLSLVEKKERVTGDEKTYRQPLSIIGRARAKQGLKREVTWNEEAGEVDQKLSTDVEEDEEEVEAGEPKDEVDLGD